MNKIILDNNVIISYLISENSTPGKCVEHCLKRDILCTSKQIIAELESKLSLTKFAKYFTIDDVQEFIESYKLVSKLFTTTNKLKICRDPKDDMFLELALKAKADFIITGDKDLLSLKEYKSTEIITPAEYLKNCNY